MMFEDNFTPASPEYFAPLPDLGMREFAYRGL